jgi:hypothetical protein
MADMYSSQRRPSRNPTPLRIMKLNPAVPPEFTPKFKVTTLDVKIPCAFIDCNPSLEDQITGVNSTASGCPETQRSYKITWRGVENHYAPNILDSRFWYRQHERVQPSNTTADSSADLAVSTEVVKVTKLCKRVKAKKGDGETVQTLGFWRYFARIGGSYGMIEECNME